MKKEILESLAKITEEEQEFLRGVGSIDRTIYMKNQKNIVNAQKLINSGRLITIRPHTRFVHFPKHTHDYIEIVYMCKGETSHIINGEHVKLSCGETLILNQHATQEVFPAGKDDIAVNFIIMPHFFNKALEMMGEEETPLRRFILDCIAGKESTNGYLHFKTAYVQEIQNLFENLILSFVDSKKGKRRINEFTMGLLLLEFINNSDMLISENIDKSIVLEVLKYIEENYRDGTLAEFSKRLHYDFHWVSREINKKTGKTFTELLQEKRLSQTEYLLANTNMRIADIAANVGYSNTNYFHRIFAQHYGMSPKKYRDTVKGKSISNQA